MTYQITYGAATVPNFSFAPHDPTHPTTMIWSAVLDMNGDGLEDAMIFTGYSGDNNGLDPSPMKVLISNGTTLVDKTGVYLPGVADISYVRNVFVADFNGDGKDDVFLNCGGTEGIIPFPGEQNRLFLSNPAGTYDDVSTTNLPQLADFSHGGGFGDFDGDRDLDIFVNLLGEEVIRPYLMLNDGSGRFTIAASYHTGDGGWFPHEVAALPGDPTYANTEHYYAEVFDMNGDGFADIWTSGITRDSAADPEHIIYRGMINDRQGHLVFSPTSGAFPELSDPATDVGEMAFPSDIDRDGDLDLVVKVSRFPFGGEDFLQLMINDGAGNFTDEATARGVPHSALANNLTAMFFIHVVDLDGDGDGDDDILVPGLNANELMETIVRVLLNKGDGTFEQVPQSAFPFLRPNLAVLDVNGDGIKDILTDITYNGPWNDDPANQFFLYLGKLDVAVNRTGWATDDRIFGGSKNDTLRGLAGDDFLQGNAGDDVIRGGARKDTLDGRAGSDTAEYSDKSLSVSVTLLGSGAAKVKVNGVIEDTLRRIENVTGGSKNDTLTGDALANRLKR